MTFESIELSAFLGKPVELYTFARNAAIWRYNTSDEDITIGGLIYRSIQIRRTNIERNQDTSRSPITVNISLSADFLFQYRFVSPSDVMTLTIQKFHLTDVDSELAVIWQGRVLNVKILEDEAEIRCEPVYTSIRRTLLRRVYQTNCPHVLYGADCLASQTTFRQSGIVTSIINGIQIVSNDFSSFADDYFTGGFIQWEDPQGNQNRRFIIQHTANVLTIDVFIPELTVGQTIFAFPGCDHTLNTCNVKFNNVSNYGGFPFMPEKNPMGGDPIF